MSHPRMFLSLALLGLGAAAHAQDDDPDLTAAAVFELPAAAPAADGARSRAPRVGRSSAVSRSARGRGAPSRAASTSRPSRGGPPMTRTSPGPRTHASPPISRDFPPSHARHPSIPPRVAGGALDRGTPASGGPPPPLDRTSAPRVKPNGPPPRFDREPNVRVKPNGPPPRLDREPNVRVKPNGPPPRLDREPNVRVKPNGPPPRFDREPNVRVKPNGPPPRLDRSPPSSRPGPPSVGPGMRRPDTVARPGPGPRPPSRPGITSTRPRGHAHHTTRVVHRSRVVTYPVVRPYHGVFVYGPRPATHVHYHTDAGQPAQVQQRHLPTRSVDRTGSLAVGLRGGSLWSGYIDGGAYADPGLGLAARYRPVETIGLELGLQHHNQTWTEDSERGQTMGSASVELFAWPWTRVSPYVLGGLTYTSRSISDEVYQSDGVVSLQTGAPLVGPHAGLGLELALGQSIAIDLEARYVGYLNRELEDPSLPGALTTTAGLMVHF